MQNTNRFEISFRTRKSNGLLIFTGNTDATSYLAIGIAHGKLLFQFVTQNQKYPFTLQSLQKLNDGQWHSVIAQRNKRKAILLIDREYKINGTLDKTNYYSFNSLNTDGLVRIGGYRRLPYGLSRAYYHAFQGCISNLKIDNRRIDLIANNVVTDYHPIRCGRRVGANETDSNLN